MFPSRAKLTSLSESEILEALQSKPSLLCPSSPASVDDSQLLTVVPSDVFVVIARISVGGDVLGKELLGQLEVVDNVECHEGTDIDLGYFAVPRQ